MGLAATYLELTVKMNGRTWGIQEKYPLKAQGYEAAETQALELITARERLMAYSVEIVHAVISDKATRGDSMIVNGYGAEGERLDDEEYWNVDAPLNDPDVGLRVNFATAEGQNSQRIFRGIRDSWVSDEKIVPTISDPYPVGGPYLAPAEAPAQNSSGDVISNLFSQIRDKVWLVQPSGDEAQPYELTAFSEWQYLGIGARDVGARHGLSRGRQPAWS